MNGSARAALIVGGIALAFLIAVPLIGGGVPGWLGGWGVMGPGMMGGFGWGWFMPVLPVLFGLLVIWTIASLAHGADRRSITESGSNRSDSALEVLKMRYARGEIGKREYEEKKKDLEWRV